MPDVNWHNPDAARYSEIALEAHNMFDQFVEGLQVIQQAAKDWRTAPEDNRTKEWLHLRNLETHFNAKFPSQQQQYRHVVAGGKYGLLAKGMTYNPVDIEAEAAHRNLIDKYMSAILAVSDRHVHIDEDNFLNTDNSFLYSYAILLIDDKSYHLFGAYKAWNIPHSEVVIMGYSHAVNKLKDRVILYGISKLS
jgi:hypothetical protein